MEFEAALKDRFGPVIGARLGGGSEADVYALNAGQVLRITRDGTSPASHEARCEVMNRLDGSRCSFDVPKIFEEGDLAGRFYTVETRLMGEPMDRALTRIEGSTRDRLIDSYMECAAEIAGLLTGGPFGDLGREDSIRRPRMRDFMSARVAASMRLGGLDLDPDNLCAPFEEPPEAAFVHLDYFPGNIICEGGRVTGVVDFGFSSVMADARFTPVLAVIYLNNRITPPASGGDLSRGMAWLDAAGHTHLLAPLRRWIAAYWSFCREDDPRVDAEIAQVLRL